MKPVSVIADWRSANFLSLMSSGPAGFTNCEIVTSEAIVVTSSLDILNEFVKKEDFSDCELIVLCDYCFLTNSLF